eukprot:TRINITY_DN16766_c0_g1_i1.p1 TRINITY_DN16766_c0_g1~~TRINITY_DN16766_c0_g1_i1.p1  ORF type:complete len:114 (-),score=5.44 TRINITY_DN16766_c0_g1_i1:101-442(-)
MVPYLRSWKMQRFLLAKLSLTGIRILTQYVSEVAGSIKFVDMIDGVTMTRQTDELTGLSSIVVMEVGQRPTAGKEMRPAIRLVGADGQRLDEFLVLKYQRNTSYLGKAIVKPR